MKRHNFYTEENIVGVRMEGPYVPLWKVTELDYLIRDVLEMLNHFYDGSRPIKPIRITIHGVRNDDEIVVYEHDSTRHGVTVLVDESSIRQRPTCPTSTRHGVTVLVDEWSGYRNHHNILGVAMKGWVVMSDLDASALGYHI